MFSSVLQQAPLSQQEAWFGQWGFRIRRATSTTIDLLAVGPNNVTTLSGLIVSPTTTASLDIASQNAVADDGTDGAVATQPSTLYYVYWINGGDFPNSIVHSIVAPSLVDGLYRLKPIGAGLESLFLGWFYTDAGTLLQDNESQRLLVNYWNRRPTLVRLRPAYNDNTGATTYALNSATWAPLNAGTGDTLEYIANGEDALHVSLTATLGAVAPAASIGVGIGDSSNTQPSASAWIPALAADRSSASTSLVVQPTVAAYRTLTMLGVTQGLATTFLADAARMGAAADPAATHLHGWVNT